jgi:alpha,alpha-trehalose-phosphate synthase [UDP-forming]
MVNYDSAYPGQPVEATQHGQWTQTRLRSVARELFVDAPLVVVSNREPYLHHLDEENQNELTWRRPPGGLVSALDPVMQAIEGGLWVAQGTGEGDRLSVDASGRVPVPPDNPAYTLKRIWLEQAEIEGYYDGFANEGLWPLCHVVFHRPRFKASDWEHYQKVNRRFADAILEEIDGKSAFVWVQDYHLCLVPHYLRQARPDLTIGISWHIPWPNPEIFRTCPYGVQLLEGLLAADVISFHIRYHGNNFLATVERELEARLDREHSRVVRLGHETRIIDIPISVDVEEEEEVARSQEAADQMEYFQVLFSLERYDHVLLGLDRFDYTKGIPERLIAVDRLLQDHPEYKEKLVFLQVGEVSRMQISHYQELNLEVEQLTQEINDRHGTADWVPIILWRDPIERADLMALYQLADVCVVSSLHDGMNLVAKEYIASRVDESGVLVLSRFTGAARELPDALLINPYDADDFAKKLDQAIQMPETQKTDRMRRMRRVVRQNNIYAWAGRFLQEMARTGGVDVQ